MRASATALPLLALLLLACLSACADRQGPARLEADTADREEVQITDPEGPIPAPTLPPDLARAQKSAPPSREGAYAYTVESRVRQQRGQAENAEEQKDDAAAEEEDHAGLIAAFEQTSLYILMDTPPQSRIGLEQRLAAALEEGREILRSHGYYSGRVWGKVEAPEQQTEQNGRKSKQKKNGTATVKVTFLPGVQYRLGESMVIAELPAAKGEDAERAHKNIPRSLADAGLAKGAPARAADVLAAVDRTREAFRNNGYPFAEIRSTRYIVDHQKGELEAEVSINPGAFVRMGDIEAHGAPSVRREYLQSMRIWRKGRPWRQSRIESLRTNLKETGLFQSIVIAPGDTAEENGERPVVVTLTSAPERTISGSVKYHSDFGPGMQAAWEHRNLTGRGDSLRVSAPLWMDMQEVIARYRLPHFFRRDQDFIASGGFTNQDTDAYRLTAAAASAGIERRLTRYWAASVQGTAQGGTIKEPDQPSRDYQLFGIPLGLRYDNTGSLLDAVKGQRLTASVTPYSGEYEGDFTALRSRLDGQAFVPLTDESRLVLALRGAVGVTAGEESANLPPSVRFYSGGGGSVRGYEYQSIGPRNVDKKPLGGGSLVEMSAESRLKITEEWGVVGFVDGGGVYEDVFHSAEGTDMRWGAGFGLRYYTVIGPVRFDVATPLNPREDDDDVQFYISIGQSF